MNGLLVACILTPMVTAALSFIVTNTAKVRGAISIGGSILLLALSTILLYQVVNGGPVSNQMGGWQAPMGITLYTQHGRSLDSCARGRKPSFSCRCCRVVSGGIRY